MVLPKGQFWEHVEETTDGIRMCKFCRHSFSKQTPITRFKFHWSGVQRGGAKICDSVPKPVRKAALEAVSQKTELRITSSSSNNCADNAISTALQEQNNQVENAVTDEATSLPSQLYSEGQLKYCLEGIKEFVNPEAPVSCAPETTPGTEQVGRESQRNTCDISPLSMEDYVMENANVQEAAFLAMLLSGQKGHGITICGQVHKEVQGAASLAMRGGNKRQKTIASSSNDNDIETRGEASQPSDMEGQAIGRNRNEKCNFLNQDDTENGTGEAAQPGAGGRQFDGLHREVEIFPGKKRVGLSNLIINRDGHLQVTFPDNIEELVIDNCNDARSLCNVSPSIKYATELELIDIKDCNSMESLVSPSCFCSAPLQSPSYNGMFSSLKEFSCYRCKSMKKLFPPVLLPNLVNLQVIEVEQCEKMEEIIAKGEEEGVMDEEFSLPKLRFLRLEGLPELKSICSAKLICDSLEEIDVRECCKLKRMPFCLPLLDDDDGQPSPLPSLRIISIYPKEWWESVVEWEHPDAKDVLLPFVEFLNDGKYFVVIPYHSDCSPF